MSGVLPDPGTFRAMQGQPGGSAGIDDAFASAWATGVGAEIMGRGKFGPHHGPWPEEEWNGWWGDTPPFGTPVFVLTHHPRPSVQMRGGTTFHFLDASPAEALARAREAAGGADVRIGGGPSTIRDFLAGRPDRLLARRRGPHRAGARGAAVGRAGGTRRPLPDPGREQPKRRHPRHIQPTLSTAARAPTGPPPVRRPHLRGCCRRPERSGAGRSTAAGRCRRSG